MSARKWERIPDAKDAENERLRADNKRLRDLLREVMRGYEQDMDLVHRIDAALAGKEGK